MFNPEVNELKKRYNILLENYQKLQGTIRALQSTNEELYSSVEKAEKERDKYKGAFEDIFTNNIGDEWERVPDSQKKAMNIDMKLSFFENELNASKLYIRRKMNDQMKDIVEENHKLKNELVQVKAKLEEREKQLENATNLNRGGHNISNSLLSDNETGVSGAVANSKGNIRKGSNKLNNKDALKKIANIFGKAELPKSTAPSRLAPTQKEQEMPNPEPPAPKEPEPTEEPVQKPSTPVESQKDKKMVIETVRQTTEFYARFNKLPASQQEQMKAVLPQIEQRIIKISFGREIILTIGDTGEYLVDPIFKEGITKGYWVEDDKPKVRTSLNSLVENKFLTNGEEVRNLVKGRPKKSYLLSKAGEAWYALTQYKDPMKSLLIVRAKEQKSIDHAHLIQNMVEILQAAGYETYQEVPIKTNSVGEESIADISANKGDYINIRIECEMGNYDTEGYIFKFMKVLEVTDRLLVGVPTVAIKEKIEEAIGEMIRSKFKGLDNFSKRGKFYQVFTLQELSNNPDLILPPQRKGKR